MPQEAVAGSLANRVATQLQDAIVSGALDLGQALSEDSIADALDVSRTPVRQALQLLQARGLVQIRPKAGTYVFEPTVEQIAELTEFRVTLERQAALWAFERSRAASAKTLAQVVETMEQAIADRDMRAYGRADTAFHEVFFKGCDNSYLWNSYTFNFAQVAALRTHLAAYTEAEPLRSFEDHKAIRDIFDSGQASELEPILAPHILRTRENYTATLRQRQERLSESRIEQLRRALDPTSFSPKRGLESAPQREETQ
ncbi:GntR family transcriptional regulator [Salinibacterium sp. SYSU T00001]|uniref:GntR family transcriptional regulator n=1 Tax=Homoserinimonas sedimenticola TaxID=2986805 RepID=UPI0022360C2C|nr:GntR family transcriptional regulator [Salinibacterium sedimenticola]MCW4385491.1 GntR family transcriptional regulator [Salinibacterium sedimenticola]